MGVTALLFGGGLGIAAAADEQSGVGVISCPTVSIASLGSVPASAEAEVERNLALLNTQIAEANNRLRTSVGQGGPNFVQNAIVGPLASKRVATINRIATAIGRQGVRPNLAVDALSRCSVVASGAAAQPTDVSAAAAGSGGAQAGGGSQAGGGAQAGGASSVGAISCPTVSVASLGAIPASAVDEVRRNLELLNTQIAEANNRLRTTVGQGGPNFVQNAIVGPLASKRVATVNRIATAIGRRGVRPNLNAQALSVCTVTANGGAAQPTNVSAATVDQVAQAAGVGTITCPSLNAASLGTIPASASAEVQRNLALLNTQLTEANNRLRNSVGQGGPNFVRNAILGPLASKRTATIERIQIAIGRQGVRPNLNVQALSSCTVSG